MRTRWTSVVVAVALLAGAAASANASTMVAMIDTSNCAYGCDLMPQSDDLSTLVKADDELTGQSASSAPLGLSLREADPVAITPNAVVPEPASLALLGLGLFGVSLARRLRR